MLSLSKRQEICCFHLLNSKLETEYIILAIDTKRKTRWTYVIFLNSSSVSLLIPIFRTSASIIRLRRLYDLENSVVYRSSAVLQLCSERDVSLPVLVTAIHVRRAVFWLSYSWTSCLRLSSYSAFPLREHDARSTWFLSTLHSCSVESFYRYFDFRETNIELPKCSSVDWNRHTPQLWTICGVHWFSWVKIEISIRRVNSTRRVMMRLRNRITRLRYEEHNPIIVFNYYQNHEGTLYYYLPYYVFVKSVFFLITSFFADIFASCVVSVSFELGLLRVHPFSFDETFVSLCLWPPKPHDVRRHEIVVKGLQFIDKIRVTHRSFFELIYWTAISLLIISRWTKCR